MERQKPESGDPRRNLEGALHEVSNALTVLLGWIAEARAPDATKEDAEHAMRIVEQRARLARDLARRAIGVAIPLSGEASLDEVLADVEESLRLELARQGHHIRREGDTAGVRVKLGEDVSQILTNLALNAIAYAPPNSEICVIARVGDASVELEVRDEGPGVPEDRRESVFEGDTQREGGAGVGLRHARAMARTAGGDLGLVASQDGAAFRLTWPRLEAGDRRMRSMPKLSVLGGARVFVLEDDLDVTGLLESALSARGAEVTLARTHKELAARLDNHDAILVDLSPIQHDLAGAMALVRRQAPNAAIVFITGSAESLPEGLEGIWVRKPFEIAEIVSALLRARSGAESGPALADSKVSGTGT